MTEKQPDQIWLVMVHRIYNDADVVMDFPIAAYVEKIQAHTHLALAYHEWQNDNHPNIYDPLEFEACPIVGYSIVRIPMLTVIPREEHAGTA